MDALAQRLDALERANAVRSARATWRRQVHEDPAVLLDALEIEPPELVGGLELAKAVEALRQFGPRRTTAVLRQAGLDRSACTLATCTHRQRRVLAENLRCILATRTTKDPR